MDCGISELDTSTFTSNGPIRQVVIQISGKLVGENIKNMTTLCNLSQTLLKSLKNDL